jgi:phosphatidate cytidylyltransferase
VDRHLRARTLTGIAFLPVLFFLIHLGGLAYLAFTFLVVLLGAREWWQLTGRPAGRGGLLLVVAGALGALQGGIEPRAERLLAFLALLLLLWLIAGLAGGGEASMRRAGQGLLGILYVGLLPAFLVRMRALPEGREALLLTYATVFLCDTAAYAVGRAIGRRPLWPAVSPRKTWEGAIGGLLGAVVAAVGGAIWFAPFLGVPGAIGFGLLAGSFGQVGDLVESRWKREAGVKDSSALLPGHGGILDRFDNLHFVAPVLYTYLTLFVS